MKKIETILLILSVIAIIANLLFVKGSGPFLILSLGSLAIFYFLNSKQHMDEPVSSIDMFKKKLSGWGMSILIIGILFTIMIWPQARFFLILGLGTLLFATFFRVKTPAGIDAVDTSFDSKGIVFIIIGATF